jgi:hypothetical protein
MMVMINQIFFDYLIEFSIINHFSLKNDLIEKTFLFQKIRLKIYVYFYVH